MRSVLGWTSILLWGVSMSLGEWGSFALVDGMRAMVVASERRVRHMRRPPQTRLVVGSHVLDLRDRPQLFRLFQGFLTAPDGSLEIEGVLLALSGPSAAGAHPCVSARNLQCRREAALRLLSRARRLVTDLPGVRACGCRWLEFDRSTSRWTLVSGCSGASRLGETLLQGEEGRTP